MKPCVRLPCFAKARLVVCLKGSPCVCAVVFLSVYVEYKNEEAAREDSTYEAVCDVSERMSCSKVRGRLTRFAGYELQYRGCCCAYLCCCRSLIPSRGPELPCFLSSRTKLLSYPWSCLGRGPAIY